MEEKTHVALVNPPPYLGHYMQCAVGMPHVFHVPNLIPSWVSLV